MPHDTYSYAEASRAEEMIPSIGYASLVANLGRFTDLGVIAHGNPVSMLVAARLVDRKRIESSGLSLCDLKRALGEYRAHPRAVYGIVKALEQAVETSLRPAPRK